MHNSEAQFSDLLGGYGHGFCIDSTALVEQAITGSTSLFPLTLGDLWRQRCFASSSSFLRQGLRHPTAAWIATATASTAAQDLFHSSGSRSDALRRLRLSQPRHSPFALVRALNGETSPMT